MDAKRGKHWQRLRAASQVLFLILFFLLLLPSGRIAVQDLPHSGAFFYIDPLNLWVNILAGPFQHPFLLALVPLAMFRPAAFAIISGTWWGTSAIPPATRFSACS